MAYVKPQTLVFQEYTALPAELGDSLRAHISGPNADLHRYSVAAEKAGILVGNYDHLVDAEYPWPSKTAGSLVDSDSVRVFIEDALLLYFEDTIGSTVGGRGVTTPVANYTNRVTSSAVAFKTSGDNARSALLKDRDVALGDIVYIRGVDDTVDACPEYELWTKVAGFAAELEDAVIDTAVVGSTNKADTTASTVINQVAGPYNCITATADGTEYDGLAAGRLTETYTVTVVKSGVTGCSAARLRVVSASGTDNDTEVIPEDFGTPTAIGTRGLTMTFSDDPGECSVSASEQAVAASQLVVGQSWTIVVTQDYFAICADEGGTYTGDNDDTYIVEVTKGGVWADLPQVTITTTRGLDASGPTIVTGKDVAIPVGSYGLTLTFVDCDSDDTTGLVLGDKFYITVASGANGPVRTLILQDNLPAALLTADDLDLRLFIPKTVEVTRPRLNAPPTLNYTIEATQVVMNAGATAYDATWTLNGVAQPLQIWSGRDEDTDGPAYGKVYIEYREFLTALVGTVSFMDGPANLDDIPGPLVPENPLKWGVYRALQNSNGSLVGYTAVADPNDVDSWQDVLTAIDGRDDIYNLIPLTRNRAVLDLYQAQVNTESTAERGNWKAMFVSLLAETSRLVVGQSTTAAQALRPTSTDAGVVLATLSDNPQATGTQYTLLTVPANNSGFIRYGVKAGDIVRYLYSIDAFGNSTYSEFIVDSVVSENSLKLLSGHTTAVAVAQKIEIHHTMTKNEIAAALVDTAQSFASNRVVAVWPDVVGSGGITQEGYFLCAALGGLVSGVAPQQGLTNVEIAGFDDLASRSRDFFSRAQLDTMAAGGIWICTEDRIGTPHTRHALTTSTVDLNRSEEMIRRNLDSISYVYQAGLQPLIGRSNATPEILGQVDHIIITRTEFLSRVYVSTLGGQLISAEVAVDSTGARLLRIHPLAADRVEIVLNLVLPSPLNNVELHLIV